MSVSMASKFDSTCKKCGIEIKAGDTIHKVNDHWCKNTNCPEPPQSKPDVLSDGIPDYRAIHHEIWEFAKNEAAKAGLDKVGQNILAQVFYKKCMDYTIHAK